MSRFDKRLSSAINGVRTYKVEARSEGYESTVNAAYWIAREAGSKDCFDLMLETAVGAGGNYTLLGDTADLPITTSTGNAATKGNQVWWFENYKEQYKFTNIGEHPLTLEVWEYVAKSSRSLEAGATVERQFMADAKHGHDQFLPDGVSTTSVISGDNLLSVSNNEGTCYSTTMTPSTSPFMRKLWKRLKRRKVVLDPQDVAHFTCFVKNMRYDPEKYAMVTEDGGAGGDDTNIIAGITKVVCWSFHGPIGRSSVAGEENIVGLIKADLAVERSIRSKIYPLLNAKKQKISTLNIDDTTGKTMVHPADHDLLDDDN